MAATKPELERRRVYMIMTRLLIARHGNTFGPNEIVRRVGKTDLSLSESGLLQGRALGNYLKNNLLVPNVIFTSSLKRTQQTANEAQKTMKTSLSLQPLTIFNEVDYGVDENQPEEMVVARLGRDALMAWEKEAKVPLGWRVNPDEIVNNWYEFGNMIIKHYLGQIILVVTSNGIARFAPYLTGNFPEFITNHSIKIATGCFSIFQHQNYREHWDCLGWNLKP